MRLLCDHVDELATTSPTVTIEMLNMNGHQILVFCEACATEVRNVLMADLRNDLAEENGQLLLERVVLNEALEKAVEWIAKNYTQAGSPSDIKSSLMREASRGKEKV